MKITPNNKILNSKINNVHQRMYMEPMCDTFSKSKPKETIDIKLRGQYPANVLSNLSDTHFFLDDVEINSMEGFLQSLKIKDVQKQKEMCALSGLEAKKLSKGIVRNKSDNLLFWNGTCFRQNSDEFKTLMNKVVEAKRNSENETFIIDGVEIKSIDGFLQALKVKNPEDQMQLCMLNTDEAKLASNSIQKEIGERTLFWNGKSFSRCSKEYQNLLKRAYKARYNQDSAFRQALSDSMGKELTHKIGKENQQDTILTTYEFIDNLNLLRNQNIFQKLLNNFI